MDIVVGDIMRIEPQIGNMPSLVLGAVVRTVRASLCQASLVLTNTVAPNALRFSRQDGLSKAENISAFSDFRDVCLRQWFVLDFPPIEMVLFTNGHLAFRGHVSQLRTYIRVETALISNSNRSSMHEQSHMMVG